MKPIGRLFDIGLVVWIVTIMVSATAGQRSTVIKGDQNVDLFGSFKDGTYRNGFLKFELKVPHQWVRFESAEVEAAKKAGVEGLKSDSRSFNKDLEAAASREVVVLAIGKKPPGSIGNSVLALGVLKQPGTHITGKMVVEAAKSLILKNPSNRLVRDVKTETIGGKEFAVFDTELTAAGGIKIPLRYYATMIREYSMTVAMTSGDDESLQLMEDSLRTIKFLP